MGHQFVQFSLKYIYIKLLFQVKNRMRVWNFGQHSPTQIMGQPPPPFPKQFSSFVFGTDFVS